MVSSDPSCETMPSSVDESAVLLHSAHMNGPQAVGKEITKTLMFRFDSVLVGQVRLW